jgi:hypothetical protein
MYGSFAVLLPKEQITLQSVILIILKWLPKTPEFLISSIPFLFARPNSSLGVNIAFTLIAILVLSGGIYWLLHRNLRTKIANTIWITAIVILFLIEVGGTLLFVSLAVASTGL